MLPVTVSLAAPAPDALAPGVHECAALEDLALSGADQAALARQGFVATEYCTRRGRRYGPYFKLRWRRQGQQQVRYLGSDPGRAEAVRRALALLQESRRRVQEFRRLLKEAGSHLRRARAALEPEAAAQGRQFHGYVLRRQRPVPSETAAVPFVSSSSSGKEANS